MKTFDMEEFEGRSFDVVDLSLKDFEALNFKKKALDFENLFDNCFEHLNFNYLFPYDVGINLRTNCFEEGGNDVISNPLIGPSLMLLFGSKNVGYDEKLKEAFMGS